MKPEIGAGHKMDKHLRHHPGVGAKTPGEPAGEGTGELERLRGELAEANERLEEYTGSLQRLQADFENHIKRSDAERREMVRGASKELIMKLLDIADTMDFALTAKSGSENETKLLDGFRRVNTNLKAILVQEGLSEVETSGGFDHGLHEAVEAVHDDGTEEGTIVDVVQKGYMLNNRLLRPAKVVVVKNRGDSDGKGNRD